MIGRYTFAKGRQAVFSVTVQEKDALPVLPVAMFLAVTVTAYGLFCAASQSICPVMRPPEVMDQDKFKVSGLTAVRSDLVDAPYVGEFPFVLECSVVAVHELGLHTQFIGEIKDVKVDDALLGGDGRVDLGRLRPLLFVPDHQAYHAIGAFVGKAFSMGKGLAGRP